MKKKLRKKVKVSTKAVRYFSGELKQYWKPEKFKDGSVGKCNYLC